MNATHELPEIQLAGVPIHAITEDQVNAYIVTAARQGVGGWLFTLNLDVMRRYLKDARFREMMQAAGVWVADGMPLVWASALQGQRLPERVCGSNLVRSTSVAAAGASLSIYLLGGNPGVAEGARDVLQREIPGLEVAGIWCPPFGFEKDEQQMQQMRTALIRANPDIVYVALGCPKQEILIEKLRADLPHAWFVGVGVSFSFLAGEVSRAPGWVQNIGAEWLMRLVQDPGRLARRYLVDDLPFAFWLWGRALLDRIRGRHERGRPD